MLPARRRGYHAAGIAIHAECANDNGVSFRRAINFTVNNGRNWNHSDSVVAGIVTLASKTTEPITKARNNNNKSDNHHANSNVLAAEIERRHEIQCHEHTPRLLRSSHYGDKTKNDITM